MSSYRLDLDEELTQVKEDNSTLIRQVFHITKSDLSAIAGSGSLVTPHKAFVVTETQGVAGDVYVGMATLQDNALAEISGDDLDDLYPNFVEQFRDLDSTRSLAEVEVGDSLQFHFPKKWKGSAIYDALLGYNTASATSYVVEVSSPFVDGVTNEAVIFVEPPPDTSAGPPCPVEGLVWSVKRGGSTIASGTNGRIGRSFDIPNIAAPTYSLGTRVTTNAMTIFHISEANAQAFSQIVRNELQEYANSIVEFVRRQPRVNTSLIYSQTIYP